METQLFRFTASHILAMLQDVLEDYRDLRNKRLRIYTYELTKSYTLQIHEAKIELLAALLGQSLEKIKKNFQLPEIVEYKLTVEEAYSLLAQLVSDRQKLVSFLEQNFEICEELKVNEYKITAKIFLLNYILGVGYYDVKSNFLLINNKELLFETL